MVIKIQGYLVNAFTKGDDGGSPTSVVLNAPGLTDLQMQDIAKRTKTSHTAFVFEPTIYGQNPTVRFFTSNREILNCGHGTVAAHYARAKQFNLTGNHSLFQESKEGLQQIEIVETENEILVFLHQNEISFTAVDIDVSRQLISALKIDSTELIDDLPVTLASPGSKRFLLALKSSDVLNTINPDFENVKDICNAHQSIGCFAYTVEKFPPLFSATARMFAPIIGVNEDLINGNSSGCLGEYLLRIYGVNNLELQVNQGQKFNCNGQVIVRAYKKEDRYHTLIGGTARIVQEVEITVDSDP
ncbi:MAG: PhzF family phenazine biosynthesis isomerase [Chitinophagales bacterium]